MTVGSIATIELFDSGDLLERAQPTGALIRQAFERFHDKFQIVGDVRGVGAMMAFELVTDRTSKTPGTDLTKALASYCSDRHLSIITAGTYVNVVRILAPLSIEDALLQKGISIMEEGLTQL